MGWTLGTSPSSPNSCYWTEIHPEERESHLRAAFQTRNTVLENSTVFSVVGFSSLVHKRPPPPYTHTHHLPSVLFLYSLARRIIVRKNRNCVIEDKAESGHTDSVCVPEKNRNHAGSLSGRNCVQEVGYTSVKLEEQRKTENEVTQVLEAALGWGAQRKWWHCWNLECGREAGALGWGPCRRGCCEQFSGNGEELECQKRSRYFQGLPEDGRNKAGRNREQ